ncbi:MAG: hypothetical protein ACE5JF_08910 [Anaerolineales bacterium]
MERGTNRPPTNMDIPDKLAFRNRDALAAFVRDRLGWSPKRYAIAILIANLAIDISAAVVLRAFVTQSGAPGLLQDATSLLVDYLMMPAMGAFYIWSSSQIDPMLQQLYDASVFVSSDSINKPLQELVHALRRGWASTVSLIVALIVALLFVGSYLDWYPWPQLISFFNHSIVLTWLKFPMWIVTIYGLSLGLYNVASTTITLRRIFRDQSIRISPWHPDRCGGLKSISQYSLTLGYAIAVLGLTLSVQTIREIQLGTFSTSYFTWFGLIAYLVLSPLAFFLPLGTAHAAMNEAKKSHLLSLSTQFDLHYKRIAEALDSEEKGIRESVQRIEALKSLYKITEDFTIWPFDVVNLRRFLTITLAPVIPGLFTIGSELVKVLLSD